MSKIRSDFGYRQTWNIFIIFVQLLCMSIRGHLKNWSDFISFSISVSHRQCYPVLPSLFLLFPSPQSSTFFASFSSTSEIVTASSDEAEGLWKEKEDDRDISSDGYRGWWMMERFLRDFLMPQIVIWAVFLLQILMLGLRKTWKCTRVISWYGISWYNLWHWILISYLYFVKCHNGHKFIA